MDVKGGLACWRAQQNLDGVYGVARQPTKVAIHGLVESVDEERFAHAGTAGDKVVKDDAELDVVEHLQENATLILVEASHTSSVIPIAERLWHSENPRLSLNSRMSWPSTGGCVRPSSAINLRKSVFILRSPRAKDGVPIVKFFV